mgnify:CR=1 FL=1
MFQNLFIQPDANITVYIFSADLYKADRQIVGALSVGPFLTHEQQQGNLDRT